MVLYAAPDTPGNRVSIRFRAAVGSNHSTAEKKHPLRKYPSHLERHVGSDYRILTATSQPSVSTSASERHVGSDLTEEFSNTDAAEFQSASERHEDSVCRLELRYIGRVQSLYAMARRVGSDTTPREHSMSSGLFLSASERRVGSDTLTAR